MLGTVRGIAENCMCFPFPNGVVNSNGKNLQSINPDKMKQIHSPSVKYIRVAMHHNNVRHQATYSVTRVVFS